MAEKKNEITLAAMSGKVLVSGSNGLRFAITPELAEELARHLPRFARLARTILPEGNLENSEQVYQLLEKLGYTWVAVQHIPAFGFWKAENGLACTQIGRKEQVTAALAELLTRPQTTGKIN